MFCNNFQLNLTVSLHFCLSKILLLICWVNRRTRKMSERRRQPQQRVTLLFVWYCGQKAELQTCCLFTSICLSVSQSKGVYLYTPSPQYTHTNQQMWKCYSLSTLSHTIWRGAGERCWICVSFSTFWRYSQQTTPPLVIYTTPPRNTLTLGRRMSNVNVGYTAKTYQSNRYKFISVF